MAFPDDIDPYAPAPIGPWGWVPPEWEQQALGAGLAPDALQPGIGVPTSALETAAAQLPAEPEPYIGFPSAPPVPPDYATDAAFQLGSAAAATFPPKEWESPIADAPSMQAGLGIPAHLIEQAAGSGQGGLEAPPPELDGEIEFPPDQLDESDRRQSLEDMDSPEFAAFAAEHEEARRQQGAASLARAAQADAQQAEDEFKIFNHSREHARNARAEVETEAAKLAATEDVSYMDSLGPGQKIAAFVSAIVGGLVAGRTGGRNDGLAMIEREVERYTASQAAKRANARQMINDKRAAANDQIQDVEGDFRAESAFRAATWERTIRTIEAEQQNYDPAGTSALRLEGVRRDAIAKQQAALAAYEEREIKRMEAEGKSRLEVAKFIQKSRDDERQRAEAERNNRAQNRAAATSAGASWLNAKSGEKKTNAEIKALELENTPRSPDHYEATYGKDGRPPHEMSGKEYKAWLDSKNKIADVSRETATGTVKQAQARLESSGPGGSPYAIGDQEGKPLVQKDGKVFEIKDDKQRQRATDVITTAQNVRRIADLVKIMREDKGGASATIGSPEYQELQSLAAQLDFETFVGYGLGAPSEGDKQLAANVRGGKDISSFIHDPSSGFEAYATGIEEKATAQLKPLGYTGAPIKLKRSEAVQATERNQLQNMDVWSPPELLDSSVDPEIRKRAAARAIESAESLAKQSEPHLIRQFARDNKNRLSEGLLDEKQAEKAHKALTKVYGRRLRDAFKARDEATLEALGVSPAMTQRKLAEGLNDDQFIELLIAEGDK